MGTLTGNRTQYDAVIVGGRCAGASTALLLARRGLRVLVLERSAYGSDTLSTHALMRAGVLQLHRWGLGGELRRTTAPAIRSTTFHYGDDTLPLAIKPRDGVDALYAPRRTVLDAILVGAAREAGAEVRHGTRVEALLRDDSGRVVGVQTVDASVEPTAIDAGIVIGADGARSSVARDVDAATYRRGRHAGAYVYGYWEGLPADGYHWYFRPGVTAGVIPTNGRRSCVFIGAPPERFRTQIRQNVGAGYLQVLSQAAPDVHRAVDAARQVGPLRSFPGLRGHLRQSYGPGWALVGDAAYFKDPISAHGITDALRDAELLADAVAAGSDVALAGYQQCRDELSTGLFDATDAMASYDWDLPAVQQLHLRLSEEMNRECEVLLTRPTLATAA